MFSYFHFQVQQKILDDISFSLLPYENTVLLGAPRSGKTSLFDLIAQRRSGEGISGEITVNGHAPGERKHTPHISFPIILLLLRDLYIYLCIMCLCILYDLTK